jgi:hypothetical protein
VTLNMTNQNPLPLYDRILLKYTFSRVMDSITLLFLILLLGYRIFYTNNYTFLCFVALLCESWFTFTWILTMNLKWNPAYTITHLDRLLLRYIVIPSITLCYTLLWIFFYSQSGKHHLKYIHNCEVLVETQWKCSIKQYRHLYLNQVFWTKS